MYKGLECCETIRISADGLSVPEAKETLGTYLRLPNSVLGPISYQQVIAPDINKQYYLRGNRKLGWDVRMHTVLFHCYILYL